MAFYRCGGSNNLLKSKVSPIEVFTNISATIPLLFDKEYWLCGCYGSASNPTGTLTSDKANCAEIAKIPRTSGRAGQIWEISGNEGDSCTFSYDNNSGITVQRVRAKNGLEPIESLYISSSFESQIKKLNSCDELVFLTIAKEPATSSECSITSDEANVKLLDSTRIVSMAKSYLYLIEGDVGKSYKITANNVYTMFRCKVL